MTGRDDVQSEAFTSTGRFDVENYVSTDPYMEEDARILSTACYFASDDEEGIMPLFGSHVRTDYSWDQSFGNLEDVGRSSCILLRPQLLATDCLEDGEAMALPKMNGMDMSKDGDASSVSHSDSEKASMAQVQSGAHQKNNRSRRRLKKHRKFVHGSAYSKSDIPPPHKLRKCCHICCKQ